MKVLDPGHLFLLDLNKNNTGSPIELRFYKDKEINGNSHYDGTTNQEVLRALISRVQFLDKQKHHPNNDEIIKCLRKALILHEQRHLDRLLEKGIDVENLETFSDSHIVKLK